MCALWGRDISSHSDSFHAYGWWPVSEPGRKPSNASSRGSSSGRLGGRLSKSELSGARANPVLFVSLAVTATPTGQESTQVSLRDDPGVESALRLVAMWLDAERAYKQIPGPLGGYRARPGHRLEPWFRLCRSRAAGGVGPISSSRPARRSWSASDGSRRDTRQLNRDVALKILPDAFAADPDRLARFQMVSTGARTMPTGSTQEVQRCGPWQSPQPGLSCWQVA